MCKKRSFSMYPFRLRLFLLCVPLFSMYLCVKKIRRGKPLSLCAKSEAFLCILSGLGCFSYVSLCFLCTYVLKKFAEENPPLPMCKKRSFSMYPCRLRLFLLCVPLFSMYLCVKNSQRKTPLPMCKKRSFSMYPCRLRLFLLCVPLFSMHLCVKKFRVKLRETRRPSIQAPTSLPAML